MPKGDPLSRTVRKNRWNKEHYKGKMFLLKGDLSDRFKAACEKAGRSQTDVVSQLMEQFIAQQETGKESE